MSLEKEPEVAPLVVVDGLCIDTRGIDGRQYPIVKDVSFTIGEGEVLALIGESGSGKTTIALSMLGYARPGCRITAGRIRVGDADVLSLTPAALRKLRGAAVSYVAQSATAAFNPALRINEQVVEISLTHNRMSRAAAQARAVELYRELALPDPESIGERFPHQLSGGQLQRLMAAMALCARPKLLILDEPTTALDVTTQIEVLKALKNVIEIERTAAIYVTHDLALVAQIADRIIVLKGGEIQEVGATGAIVERPSHSYTKTLMAAVRPPPHAVDDGESKQAKTCKPPIVEIKDVTAGYGGVDGAGNPRIPVLWNVDLTIRRSSVVGVIGESGCGKSTLARVVAGLLPWARGTVLLDGVPLPPRVKDRSREQLRKLQIVFQMADAALNPRQTVGQILGRPLEFFHGMAGAGLKLRIAELLDMVRLPRSCAERYPTELSGGQKQRVNLARALAAEPELVLCDEVTSELDAVVGATIIDLLKELRRSLGIAYLFISHDLSTVASFADEIAVLYAGRLVEVGETRSVLRPPRHPYSDLLVSSVPEMRIGWLEDTAAMRSTKSALDVAMTRGGSGCAFADRCPFRMVGLCEREAPPARWTDEGLVIFCHRTLEELRTGAPASGSGPGFRDATGI
jgi:peptide/nickel transport system ATP-binding protein